MSIWHVAAAIHPDLPPNPRTCRLPQEMVHPLVHNQFTLLADHTGALTYQYLVLSVYCSFQEDKSSFVSSPSPDHAGDADSPTKAHKVLHTQRLHDKRPFVMGVMLMI